MPSPLKLAALVALLASASAAAQQTIKIGHVGPVSGPNAHLGKDNENAARMAIDELNATDHSAILTKIRATKPDLVFFGGMDSVAGPMLRQLKALGIEAKFMGGDGICTEALGRLAGPAVGEGKVFCAEAGGVKGAQEQAMTDFRARFKQKTGAEVQLYAPYVYAVMVMAAAMQAAKSAEPAKYLPELKKIRYEGVTGTIQFDPNGDIRMGR